MGSRAVTGNGQKRANLRRFLLLPFPPVVTCKKKTSNHTQPVDFSCSFFVCRSAFLPSLFSSLPNLKLSLVARRVDGWIGNFPPPISFLQRRCCPPLPWLRDRRQSKLRFSAPSSLSFGLPSHFLIVFVTSCWRREDVVGLLMVVGREREDLIRSLMEKKKQNQWERRPPFSSSVLGVVGL